MSQFTEMKVFPIKNPTNALVGRGQVVIGGLVQVKFSVLKGSKGIFATFPASKGNKTDDNGKPVWFPDFKILNKDLYQEFQTLVAKEFEEVMGKGTSSHQPTGTDGVPF